MNDDILFCYTEINARATVVQICTLTTLDIEIPSKAPASLPDERLWVQPSGRAGWFRMLAGWLLGNNQCYCRTC